MSTHEGINALNFKVCDTHGGDAYRDWWLLMKHKGVFIGFHNHNWVELASSDPNAEWRRGCQEARAYGDPAPQSDTAKLVSIESLPAEGQALARRWVEEALAIAQEKIARIASYEQQQKMNEAKRAKEEYERNVASPWRQAAKECK